ncbi:hypothetical protein L596_004299 [Steinernema carpocapsae]|uniref:Solute carrier family 3 member 2 N-terminal domain-containing protein n=1 Tax=Steinernema carpocapsae TaxID=34508 RepID=A0A4U8UVB2_STECR|nr:hypothetical protein L596_004299 [Steinernema carpocapsae]
MFVDSDSMPSSECEKIPRSYNLEATEFSEQVVGLTEEQLKMYRNNPFWRTIRYAVFGAFWGVFAAMLGGAIAIVLIAKL